MSLNKKDWREFRIGDLFKIRRGDRIVHNEDYFDLKNDEFKYPVITTTMMNNGVDGFYNQTNCEGNCIVSGGEASGMFTTYQEKPFWGLDTIRIYEPIDFTMDKYIGMFLATELTYNMYRFSYGRKAKPANMYTLDIKLPVDHSGNPDWKFMERYIKSLHYKLLTTKNKKSKILNLDINNWREFRIGDLFNIERGQRLIANDREGGSIAYFSASQDNNGCTDHINNPLFIRKDGLIYDTFGDCYYVSGEFTASDEISILSHKKLNQHNGLFIATIMTANKYKYAFGRKAFQNKFVDNYIKLPVDSSGDPNWKFMEDYMKSLPYGDRLKG